MTYDGDPDPPKVRKASGATAQGKDVPLLPLDASAVHRLLYLIDQVRVPASIRRLTEEVVAPEGGIEDDYLVLHVEARYVLEQDEEGRWIVTRDQAGALIKAGAYDGG